ncbi:class I SAM-dependent methyltransferase [Dactylosporangium sp. CS-047395]|uniref:class I SAM-dependent methyltransferase n=1 Tax=Dactylosporangium sp. CS-047395 TaxID=3239936 RepID=UPI003D94AC28
MHNHGHDHGHGHGHHHGGLADLLDLDAAVLRDYHAGIVAWVAGQGPVATIADLGAGTGAGTFGLLRQFPDATVTAVDSDEDMLHRLAGKAAEHGLGDRVRTRRADLDSGWPADLAGLDLIWAANSMHHMADPPRVLRDIRAALAPGGRLALSELDSFPRFLPDGAAGGLEDRTHAAMARRREQDMPHMQSDWAALIAAAGLKVTAERRFETTLAAPLPEAAVRYARASLARTREGLAEDLGPADLAALDALLGDGPDALTHRTDLTIRAARTVWIAEPA